MSSGSCLNVLEDGAKFPQGNTAKEFAVRANKSNRAHICQEEKKETTSFIIIEFTYNYPVYATPSEADLMEEEGKVPS